MIVWLAVTRVRSRLWAVVLGLLLGGVLGNLTDRLFREPGFPVGHVVDFISTPWMMPAIYNVADIFIVAMMIAVALLVLLGLHIDGTREVATHATRRRPMLGEATSVPPEDGVAGFRDAIPRGRADTGAPRDRSPAPTTDELTWSRAAFPCPTVWRGRGSMPPWRRCSASRAPSRPRSPRPAASRWTACARQVGSAVAAEPGSRSCGSRKEEPRVVPIAVPDLGIVYDDDDIVVVDKPPGVAAHPSRRLGGSDGARARWPPAASAIATTGAAERQGIVHRLDVGTSGLMVVAKTERAYTALKRAFKEREVEKIYHAVVQGHPDPLAGTIDAPIGRHPYALVEVRGDAGRQGLGHALRDARGVPAAPSLLEIHLETGRTHQIRVHMAAHRHPCVGDPLYGADPTLSARLGLTRQWLHARQLAFAHPATGEWVRVRVGRIRPISPTRSRCFAPDERRASVGCRRTPAAE